LEGSFNLLQTSRVDYSNSKRADPTPLRKALGSYRSLSEHKSREMEEE